MEQLPHRIVTGAGARPAGGLLALPARIVRGSPPPHHLMRRVVPVFIVLVCLLAPAVAGAGAQGGKKLIQDCADDGEVNGTYTPSDFTYALKHLPTDLDEYTNCRAAIERAQLGVAGKRPGGGGTGGGPLGGGALGDLTAPTPQEKAAIAQAARRAQPVRVAGNRISPGGRALFASSRAHSLPGSVLLLLILIAAAVLARAAVTIRSRVLARRQA